MKTAIITGASSGMGRIFAKEIYRRYVNMDCLLYTSHILNAEGEKMEAILSMENTQTDDLLRMNQSAELMVGAVTRLELILQGKVELFAPCNLIPDRNRE